MIGLKKLVGNGIDVVGWSVDIITFFVEGTTTDVRLDVDIFQLDVSTQDLIVGDVFEVVGRAKVIPGNIMDCGLWHCARQDATVWIEIIVDTTKKTDKIQAIISNMKNAEIIWKGWAPANMVQADVGAIVEMPFRFIVQASGDDVFDSVTVKVCVNGPDGDQWGSDQYRTECKERKKPFFSRQEFTTNVEINPANRIVEHGETFDVKLSLTNRSTEPFDILLGQVGGVYVTNLLSSANSNRVLIEDNHPHTEDHILVEGLGTDPKVKPDAIEVDPIRVVTAMKLKSGTLHIHDDLVDSEKASSDCTFFGGCDAVPYDPMPEPEVMIEEFEKDPPLTGRIVDSLFEKPISGAEVNINGILSETNLQEVTDEKGEFRFDVFNNTSWTLTVNAEGYDPYQTYAIVINETSVGDIAIDPLFTSVKGQLVDEKDVPLTAALLRFSSDSEDLFLETYSNSTGHFHLIGIPWGITGEINLIPQDPPPVEDFRYFVTEPWGIAAVTETIDLGKQVLLLRTAETGAVNISGAIADKTGQIPANGTKIEIVSSDTQQLLASTEADILGRWETKIESGSEIEIVVLLNEKEVYRSEPLNVIKNVDFHNMRIPVDIKSYFSFPMEAQLENMKVKISWVPITIEDNIPIHFKIEIVDTDSNARIFPLYDIMLIDEVGNVIEGSHRLSQMDPLQSFTFENTGKFEVRLENIDNTNESASFSVSVIPEFQEIVLLVLGSSILLVIVFARKFSKFTVSENP